VQQHVHPFAERPLPVTGPAHGLSWRAAWTRLRGESEGTAWEQAAAAWDALSRPHRAAYARWRQAESLLARPGGKAAATTVLRAAARQAAQHVRLSDAIRGLARRARIDLTEPDASAPSCVRLLLCQSGRDERGRGLRSGVA
jgi:hypothetical protein